MLFVALWREALAQEERCRVPFAAGVPVWLDLPRPPSGLLSI